MLRYILFHHQTTTSSLYRSQDKSCVISSFITKPQHIDCGSINPKVALYPLSSPNHNKTVFINPNCMLRYILFHHQTTTWLLMQKKQRRCVISSFITKPQPPVISLSELSSCVISSFITKPQHSSTCPPQWSVALYPLSSPNHNQLRSSPQICRLRYILFHHQTTTMRKDLSVKDRCVISSFITKPQLVSFSSQCVSVALYPLSSPNHNPPWACSRTPWLRYILFHHQTTTSGHGAIMQNVLRYILFHHQTTTSSSAYLRAILLRYILFHHQTTTRMR